MTVKQSNKARAFTSVTPSRVPIDNVGGFRHSLYKCEWFAVLEKFTYRGGARDGKYTRTESIGLRRSLAIVLRFLFKLIVVTFIG